MKMEESYIIYHYCTVETFKNILKSKVLWLCNLIDSNDDEEVIRTFVNLWEGVKKKLRQTDLSSEMLDQVFETIDAQYKIEIKVDPPYGICFCQKDDLLFQWKEYGDNTRGLSLGFDINWFMNNDGIKQQKPHPNSIQSNAIGCDNVIYHSEDVEKKLAGICYEALKRQGASAWIRSIRPTFKHYSAFIKNPTFKPESEIRIVYYPMEEENFSEKDVNISDLKTNIKKHYEIPWINGNSQALKSICIGHNCDLKETDIRRLLEENGVKTDIEIKQSECSYRIRKLKIINNGTERENIGHLSTFYNL